MSRVQNSKVFQIDSDFITLGQLLKEEGIIPTGGAAKWFLREHQVKINGELDNRRGKKIRPNDEVEIVGIETVKIESKQWSQMILQELHLKNFRNYDDLQVTFYENAITFAIYEIFNVVVEVSKDKLYDEDLIEYDVRQ